MDIYVHRGKGTCIYTCTQGTQRLCVLVHMGTYSHAMHTQAYKHHDTYTLIYKYTEAPGITLPNHHGAPKREAHRPLGDPERKE